MLRQRNDAVGFGVHNFCPLSDLLLPPDIKDREETHLYKRESWLSETSEGKKWPQLTFSARTLFGPSAHRSELHFWTWRSQKMICYLFGEIKETYKD